MEELEERESLQRNFSKSASVKTRRQRSMLSEMEERKSMHGGALRLDLESEESLQRNFSKSASVLTRRQRSLLIEMEKPKSMQEGAQKIEVDYQASVSTRNQRSLRKEIGEKESTHEEAQRVEFENPELLQSRSTKSLASVSTRKQRTLPGEKEELESMQEGAQRIEVDYQALVSTTKQKTIQKDMKEQASVSRRKQRSLRKEIEENDSTQEGAQRVDFENPVASVSTRNQRTSQRGREESSSLSTRKQRTIQKEEEESTQEVTPRLELESHASVSTRKQRNSQEEKEERDFLQISSKNSSSASTRKQQTIQREGELLQSRSKTASLVLTRKQNNFHKEMQEQASASTREQRALRREIEKRVSLNRSYTTSQSTLEGAQRLELETHESTQEEIIGVERSEEESHAYVSATKQRTSHREKKERVCKDMKNKALPDQDDVGTFQTKGYQYDYVENKTHSTKSMSFRNFATPHKGLVLVIVNYSFPNKPLERGNDIEEIEQLFPGYGYKVYSFTDLNKEDILSKVKLYSEKENMDRFICFISSHGNQTSLACPNGGVVRINDILSAANTKQLENKPKVFFIDACRVNLNQDIKESECPEPPSTEYYVGFSCLASKISLVGKDSCGVYIQALIEVFKDGFWRSPRGASKTRDINHFMEKVHYRVNKQKDKQGNNYQMPIFRSTLTGKLFLQGDIDVSDTLHNTCIY